MMLFRRHATVQDIRAGAVYRRVHRDNIVETAKVTSVGRDSYGIPHVHFKVCYSRPDRKFLEDARVLALESFTQHYGEQAGY